MPAGFCLTQGKMIFSSSKTWYTPQKTCQEKEMRSDGGVCSIGEGGSTEEEIPESGCCSNILWGFYSQISNNTYKS